MLETARQQLQESTDKAAIAFATTTSTAAEDDKDYVKAYEVLADLTPVAAESSCRANGFAEGSLY